jgi:general secretion pathway protein G
MNDSNTTDICRASPRGARAPARGFTLIELLVVIAILGILGTVVLKNVWGYIDEAKQKAAKEKVDNVDTQLQMYKRKHNELPRDLRVLLDPDPMMNGEPWLPPEALIDPWDNPIDLKIDDKNQFEVISYGENKMQDGFDLSYGLNRDIGSKHPLDPPKDANR